MDLATLTLVKKHGFSYTEFRFSSKWGVEDLSMFFRETQEWPPRGDVINLWEHAYQKVLTGFLKCQNSSRLKLGWELNVTVVEQVLNDFPDETLERKFPDQKFRRLLILSDLEEGAGSWTVTTFLSDLSVRGDAGPLNWSGSEITLGPRHVVVCDLRKIKLWTIFLNYIII